MATPELHEAKSVMYEGAGDTLRVRTGLPTNAPPIMRDVLLAIDAAGHLVAVIFEDQPPRPVIALGPQSAVHSWKRTRVLAMEDGTVLVTMAAKRIRGAERNPYVPWSVYPAEP